jgi:hypothetical protein
MARKTKTTPPTTTPTMLPPTTLPLIPDGCGFRVGDDGSVTVMTKAETKAVIARAISNALKKLRVTTVH